MRKLLLTLTGAFLLMCSAQSQNVAFTSWINFDTLNQQGLYWYFDADTCWFSGDNVSWDSVSVYDETATQFMITDLFYPSPNYCGYTGTYNKVFSGDTLWLVPVDDTCDSRNDYFTASYFISQATAIGEPANSSIRVSPNPTSGVFTIATTGIADRILVTDVNGRIVAEQIVRGLS